jgi:hypothetical protein
MINFQDYEINCWSANISELESLWQSDAEKMGGGVDRMVSENEWPFSVNQQLIEANQLLAIDRQNPRVVQEWLDLARAWIDVRVN